jgi:hypothetical protein
MLYKEHESRAKHAQCVRTSNLNRDEGSWPTRLSSSESAAQMILVDTSDDAAILTFRTSGRVSWSAKLELAHHYITDVAELPSVNLFSAFTRLEMTRFVDSSVQLQVRDYVLVRPHQWRKYDTLAKNWGPPRQIGHTGLSREPPEVW